MSSSSYRPDIDGLRAIAVLAVIVFHVDERLLPGGFVGVDIFFVISGFLITRNILQEILAGRFSITEFYRRRVKRIAPAMLVVVAFTLLLSQHLMIPEDAERVAESSLWSLLSLANVYFWLRQDTSYFAADSRETPLLHLWSLGVEEQFYFVWPLLLLLLFRRSHWGGFAATLAIVAAASFALGEWLFHTAPSFVYFMLPTRAGELLLGGLAAIASLAGDRWTLSPRPAKVVSIIGIALVAWSLVFTSKDNVFPGLRAIPPTLGTSLVILAGATGVGWVFRILAMRPMVWVGLVSYSAYLWHWPLLAFYRYGYGGVGPVAGGVIVFLTLLLAWLTYRYVEQPARRSSAPFREVMATQYVAPAGLLIVLSLGAMYADGVGLRGLSESYRLGLAERREERRPAFAFDYVCQRQRLTSADLSDERCVIGSKDAEAAKAILIGDSNAAHFVGMLEVFAREGGFAFRNAEIGSCPPVRGDPGPFVLATREADCQASLDLLWPVVEKFPVIIVSASWSGYQKRSPEFMARAFETLSELASSGKLVVILGKVPVMSSFDGRCWEKALSYPLLECVVADAPLPADVESVNAALREFAEGTENVEYYDVTSHLCPKGSCSAFDADGRARYYDTDHLRIPASVDIGKEILQAHGLPVPFALIRDWPPKSPVVLTSSHPSSPD